MADRTRQTRKRRATTSRIQDAALSLFQEKGYEQTTLQEIAERADVATRTLTHHFPAKHDLVIAVGPWSLDSLRAELGESHDPEAVLSAVRRWYLDGVRAAMVDEDEDAFWSQRRARARVIRDSKVLQGYATASFAEFEQLIALHLASRGGEPAPGPLVPRLVALSIMGGLRELHFFYPDVHAHGSSIEELLDVVLDFARAGLSPFSPALPDG